MLGLTYTQIQGDPTGYMRVVRQLLYAYGLYGAYRYLRFEQRYRNLWGIPSQRLSGQYTNQQVADLVEYVSAVWLLAVTTDKVIRRVWTNANWV